MSSSRYRNARIGDLLKHRHLAEKRGTEIPLVVRALERNGSEPPLFETDADMSFFRATIFLNDAFVDDERYIKPEAKNRKEVGDLKGSIRQCLRDNGAMSMRELADALGYSRNAPNLYVAVRTLVSEKLVEYTIPDKIKSRNQRIRLKISGPEDH